MLSSARPIPSETGADGALRQDRHRRGQVVRRQRALAGDAQGDRGRHGRCLDGVQEYKETQIDTGKRTSADGFGTREFLKNDYMDRMSGAVLGIYGNSKEEAIYPVYFVDASKQTLDGANRYTLRFAPGQLPPVNAFWSLTMYELPASLLYANPLNRYLINSPMLPEPEARRRWRDHALRPARVAGQGQGIQLAAGAEGPVLHGACACIGRSPRRWTAHGRRRRCSG